MAEKKPVLRNSCPGSLGRSVQPVNDENKDPKISSSTKAKSVDNNRASLEEKEETADSEAKLESSTPASDETGATIAPISLPTSIPTPIFLKRKLSAKEAIDCTPKRMRFALFARLLSLFLSSTTKRRKEQKTVQDDQDTSSKCRLFEGDDSSSDSDSSL